MSEVAVASKKSRKQKVHHGQLLDTLRNHFKLNHTRFSELIPITYQHENENIKKEIISKILRDKVCRAFSLDASYWDGNLEALNEASISGETEAERKLKKQNAELQDQLNKQSKLMSEINIELLRLMKELNEKNTSPPDENKSSEGSDKKLKR